MDYGSEMTALAAANPTLVKTLTLPFRTWEGRPVEGIEITTNPNERDGKPVFLQLGVHHAREWPSGEHALEWAYELSNGYRAGNARARKLVENTRTIVIPVVNPDGFNASREAGELQRRRRRPRRRGRDRQHRRAPERVPPQELPPGGRQRGRQLQSAGRSALASPGVDPNRNYGAFWGGPGAERRPDQRDLPRAGPFSEPETQNIRALVSARQVITLITNHTFSNLVLRPPGIASQGPRRTSASSRRSATRWLPRTATRASSASSSMTPPARPRTGATTRPAASGSRSRSGRSTSTRPTPRWSPSTRARRRRRAPGAATARPTSRRSRTPPTCTSTRS